MVVIPDSDIFLLKSPLQIDNKNQLTFTNATAQYNYFSSLTKLELEGAKYQRKDGAIRFDGNFDDLVNYNYCMYKNTHYRNKWFYAFVIGMEYKNDNCTYVYIKTDVWQSWQFDIVYKQSFIEREMINVSNDVPGANLVPESLELGEYKVGGTAEINDLNPVYITAYAHDTIKIKPTVVSNEITVSLAGSGGVNSKNINGIPTHVFFICTKNYSGFQKLNNALDIENQSEYVVANFTVPELAVKGITHNFAGDGVTIDDVFVLGGKANATNQTLVSTPSALDGYSPVNQKLRQYPFLYLGFNPSQGSSRVFRYEDFANGSPSFDFISEVNPNPTICVIPKNYRGQSGNSMSDIVTMNGYPQLSTKVDVYNSWLAENSGIINVQASQKEMNATYDLYSNALGMAGGILGMVGAGASGMSGGNGSSSGAFGRFYFYCAKHAQYRKNNTKF